MQERITRAIHFISEKALILVNAVLNMSIPLAGLGTLEKILQENYEKAEDRDSMRLVYVGGYVALTCMMELRSARRANKDFFRPERAQNQAQAQQEGEEEEEAAPAAQVVPFFPPKAAQFMHAKSIEWGAFYQLAGKIFAVTNLSNAIGGRRVACVSLVVGSVGGFVHFLIPQIYSEDIIHQHYRFEPPQSRKAYIGQILLRTSIVIGAMGNTKPYVFVFQSAASYIADAIFPSRFDEEHHPHPDQFAFTYFLIMMSLTMVHSKFCLYRNRAADIWNQFARASSWRQWWNLTDLAALLGAAAHSVFDFWTTDWLLREKAGLPEQWSYALSALLATLTFPATYCANAQVSQRREELIRGDVEEPIRGDLKEQHQSPPSGTRHSYFIYSSPPSISSGRPLPISRSPSSEERRFFTPPPDTVPLLSSAKGLRRSQALPADGKLVSSSSSSSSSSSFFGSSLLQPSNKRKEKEEMKEVKEVKEIKEEKPLLKRRQTVNRVSFSFTGLPIDLSKEVKPVKSNVARTTKRAKV